MPLSIKDREADDLARKLAAETGESITEAVKQALRERLSQARRRRERTELPRRLLEIGGLCAAHMSKPVDSLDHAELLYDDRGLPK